MPRAPFLRLFPKSQLSPFEAAPIRNFRIGDRSPRCSSGTISSTHSNVILNAVKDLRLPLRFSMWRYFRVGDDTSGTRNSSPNLRLKRAIGKQRQLTCGFNSQRRQSS